MPRYNHLVAIAFSLHSTSPTVDGATPDEILKSLTERVEELKTDMFFYRDTSLFHEYIEDLGDTFEEDE